MSKSRLEALKDFLAAEPDDSFTRYALALEYISRGDEEQGEALLRETIARDTAYVASYQQLAQLLARQRRVDEARETYERGIAAARRIRDIHAASEMQRELEDMDEE